MKHFKFINYCWAFYGPNQIYGHFFGNTLEMAELTRAVSLRAKVKTPEFCGDDCDSFDRELVRDIMLHLRGEPTEYNVAPFCPPVTPP